MHFRPLTDEYLLEPDLRFEDSVHATARACPHTVTVLGSHVDERVGDRVCGRHDRQARELVGDEGKSFRQRLEGTVGNGRGGNRQR